MPNCKVRNENSKSIVYEDICKDLPVSHDKDGEYYCVLHFPSVNKHRETNFTEVITERLQNNNCNFAGVYFPVINIFKDKKLSGEINFNNATFADEGTFKNTIFDGKTKFIKTKFLSGADFTYAKFLDEVTFNLAECTEVFSCSNAVFKKNASFRDTEFNGRVFFWNARFIEKAKFDGVKFFEYVFFNNVTFNNSAEFNGGLFDQYVYFSGAKFLTGGDYADAEFNGKSFFNKTIFNVYADFGKVKFGENSQIDFHETIFKGDVYFNKTIVEGYLEFLGKKNHPVFVGDKVRLSLQQARIEKAKRISFRNTILNPHWFVDVNLKDFIFLDVDWINADGSSKSTNLELQILTQQKVTGRPHRLLNITCRQLATNYEDSKHFEQASNFRRMAMQLIFWEKWLSLKAWLLHPLMLFLVTGELKIRKYKLPKQKIYKRWKEINKIPYSFWQSLDIPHYLYRVSSFYGESWGRATFVLVVIIFIIFPFIYTKTEFQITPKTIPLEVVVKDCQNVVDRLKPVCKIEHRGLAFFSEAIPHSLATASLQTVEYRIPKSPWGSVWIILEKIFAPLQVALLALAIRRKFMR